MSKVTVDSVLTHLKRCVEDKVPVGPEVWLKGAQTLIVLLGDEHDKLFTLQQKIAQVKCVALEAGKSAAHAKIAAEAMDEYRKMQTLKAKIDGVIEMVRIAKLQSRLKSDEMKSY